MHSKHRIANMFAANNLFHTAILCRIHLEIATIVGLFFENRKKKNSILRLMKNWLCTTTAGWHLKNGHNKPLPVLKSVFCSIQRWAHDNPFIKLNHMKYCSSRGYNEKTNNKNLRHWNVWDQNAHFVFALENIAEYRILCNAYTHTQNAILLWHLHSSTNQHKKYTTKWMEREKKKRYDLMHSKKKINSKRIQTRYYKMFYAVTGRQQHQQQQQRRWRQHCMAEGKRIYARWQKERERERENDK